MPRTEDYLDSLLDSLTKGNTDEITSDSQGSDSASADSDYLHDLENILNDESDPDDDGDDADSDDDTFGSDSDFFDEPAPKETKKAFYEEDSDISEDMDFLREFEKDMGIYDEAHDIFDETNVSVTKPDSPAASADFLTDVDDDPKDDDDDILGSLNDILNTEDTGMFVDDGLSDIGTAPDTALNEAASAGAEVMTEPSDSDADVMSDVDENIMSDVEEPAPAEDDGVVLSDVEDDGVETISDSEDAAPAEDSGEASGAEDSSDTEGSAEGEGENISEEEIMDIGNLLDSIDEEGNINMPDEGSGVAVDENGIPDAVSVSASDAGEPIDEEEKKQNIFQRILGKLFKKKDKSPDEGDDDDDEIEYVEIEEEEGEGPTKEELKAQKKEEKAKKKKEKEEEKKKAKAEKEAAKKAAPPKEKKKKLKKVDKSPKIPIKVLIPFVLLAVSLVVLWNVAKNAISYELEINAGKRAFDNQNYMDSYTQLSGMVIEDEDDLALLNRAKLMSTLEMRYKAYEMYAAEEKHIYALDNLVRGAVFYKDHSREAEQMGIPSEFDALGRNITQVLFDKYNVDEKQANDLVEIRDRKEYTRELYYVLEAAGLWSLED